MRRIGILGGTFDPIHRGHLALARAAERRLRLERVYFVVARRPWHKAAPGVGFEDRYAMVALALAGRPRWQPLAVPAAGAATYSVDEVAWIRRREPRARLYFLIGADAFAALGTWKDYRHLARWVRFGVAPRQGWARRAVVAALPAELRGLPIDWLAGFRAPGRSSELRAGYGARRAAARAALPARVREYIARAGLYIPKGGSPPARNRPR